MPAISKIRFVNIVYENGDKRYNDDVFQFDGNNAAILLENGGGKTVFVQTAIQAVLPNAEVADRKIRNTLMLENNVAHVAIEWILSERPRRYGLTAVTLFINRGAVESLKYVYEYEENDDNSIEKIPFVLEGLNGNKRPATKEEIGEYYGEMSKRRINAHSFSTAKEYHGYIEDNFFIVPSEWRNIALINGAEGGVEAFFDNCKTTGQLVDSLLIPVIEEALAGKGTKDFAETFEKQREHFKKHKYLRARIEESQSVETQIGYYVNVFKNYDEVNLNYINAKEKAKAIFTFIKKEAEINEEKLNEANVNKDMILKEEERFEQKKASLKLSILKENVSDKEKILNKVKDKYNNLLESNNSKKKRYGQLKVAKFNKEIKEYQEELALLEEKIETLDKDEDIVDIQEKLSQNSGELLGYFREEEGKLVKNKTVVEGQINTSKKEKEEYESEFKKAEESVSKFKINEGRLDSSIGYLTDEMIKIEREILYNHSNESVDDEYLKWVTRSGEIEDSIFKFDKELKSFEEEKDKLNFSLPSLREELNNIAKEETRLEGVLDNIDKEHLSLLEMIKNLRLSWSNIDSLYLRKESILNGLKDKIERLREEKERLQLKERVAYRLFDNYKESEFYTADPLLEDVIKTLRNSFKYIECGTEYIQRVSQLMGKDIKEIYEAYPYWSVAIIISDTEIDKFYNRVNKYLEEFSHPIIIMTEQEAKSRIQGEAYLKERSIFPLSWEKNLSQNLFEKWKIDIEAKALESKMNHKSKEEEFNLWSEALKRVNNFYEKHPHEEYVDYQKHHKALLENIITLKKDIEIQQNRILQLDKEIKKINNILSELQGEKNVIESKIKRAQDYKAKKNEKQKKLEEKYNNEKALKLSLELSEKWKGCVNSSLRIIEELKGELSDIKHNLSDFQGQPLYDEVRNATPKHSSLSKKALENKRTSLKEALDKKQKGREVIELNIKSTKDRIKYLTKELENHKKTSDFILDTEIEFTIYGESEMDRLLEQLESLKNPLNRLEDEYETSKQVYSKEKNTYEIREEDFYKIYDEVIAFTDDLKAVKKALDKEKIELKKKKEYILNRIEQMEKDKKEIDKAINELRVINGEFTFLAESIKEIQLDSEIYENIPYKRLEFVKNIQNELKNLLIKANEQNSDVEKQKKYFINFCNSNITDVRLRQMSISGVQYKTDFKDIIEWQQKMNDRISRIIEIAENDIKEHDKQLQQFINHLHSYIMTMSQELKLIPRKTRIKVENDWKDIFTFNIPEWDEKEGKEELSKHLDWMLKQLESDQFKEDDGEENADKVTKAIEKWLQSKELLRIVMKENTIKIRCRKVTNDGKVSSSPFSWEQSNAWSGGEKWSKNMTLFLGILNYLAEKRKQISSNMKRHRTVIVDNPFGKASSDHVLDPVFFVAEQLGFQIIALTAHAEGKFVRTYFPIVYSCRLRESSNGTSQIMTKEKEIKMAFFKDSDSETLMRLGQIKQLGFFEY